MIITERITVINPVSRPAIILSICFKSNLNLDENEIINGKGIVVKSGKDITIATIAPQLQTVIKAADKLEKENNL